METMPGIRWRAHNINVDIDTGEVITEKERVEKYIIIKTIKHVEINHIKTRGTIEYTKQCRRNPQGSLFNSE